MASPEVIEKNGEVWTSGLTLSSAIGQISAFSPIQMAKYIAMVANRGQKINPTIIKRIMNADGTESSRAEINE